MMIKTLDNVYINMEDFSGFTIGYPNDFDFTVMAMKELVDNQTAAIELGRYPSENARRYILRFLWHVQVPL
jgi:tryptophan synthase alpha subunit